MTEPISPEAYLAIATSLQKAVNSCRDKIRAEQNDKTTNPWANSSKPTLALSADELLSYSGLKVGSDGYVQWDMDNPEHPRNWARKRKAFDFGLILFSEFFMSAISAGGAPASFDGVEVLGQGREVGLVAFTTMYLLGQALGALLLSPYSHKSGRRTLYIGSAFLYSAFCIPVAATSTIAGVFAGRLITGVVSAVPAVTTRLGIEDLFDDEGRMWAFFSWGLVTNLGLVLGPVYASYVAASLNWRWPFYLASIIVAVTGMLMYFMRESHTSLLLERTVAAIRPHRPDLILRTAPMASRPRPSIFQPAILLLTNPTILLSSVANAFSTALLYLFAVAFPLIYAHYAWNRQKSTFIFLFIAVGLFFSTLTRFHERHATRKSHLTNRRLPPEKALFGLAIGAPALAAGLWWFAWTIPSVHVKTLSWPASGISLILVGYGINEYTTILPRYILNPHSHKSNHTDASSAFTAILTLRALLSAIFPLFTTQMFENLGTNTAGSVLAAIATAFCLLPYILKTFGAEWRRQNGESDAIDNDSNSTGNAQEEVTKIEKKKHEKPKKTVRWGDETDSGTDPDTGFSEPMKSDDDDVMGNESTDSHDTSRTETEIEQRDVAMKPKNSDSNTNTGTEDEGNQDADIAGTKSKRPH